MGKRNAKFGATTGGLVINNFEENRDLSNLKDLQSVLGANRSYMDEVSGGLGDSIPGSVGPGDMSIAEGTLMAELKSLKENKGKFTW